MQIFLSTKHFNYLEASDIFPAPPEVCAEMQLISLIKSILTRESLSSILKLLDCHKCSKLSCLVELSTLRKEKNTSSKGPSH